METRQGDLKLIASNWETLLPAAEKGFEEHGRGMVLADISRIESGGHPIRFIRLGDLPPDDEECRRMVTRYDPQREVVISVIAADGLVHSYQLGRPTATPLQRQGLTRD